MTTGLEKLKSALNKSNPTVERETAPQAMSTHNEASENAKAAYYKAQVEAGNVRQYSVETGSKSLDRIQSGLNSESIEALHKRELEEAQQRGAQLAVERFHRGS